MFSFQIKDLERDLDGEVRRSNEFQKAAKKSDRRLKEIAFQAEEDSKNIQRLQEQSDRLNNKIKKMRVQLDEAVSFFFLIVILINKKSSNRQPKLFLRINILSLIWPSASYSG